MLNQKLYDKLVEACEQVHVTNEGDPGSYEVSEPPVGKSLFAKGFRAYAYMPSWGECYSVCCPICKDTRFRLYFGHRWGTTVRTEKQVVYFGKRTLCDCKNESCQKSTKHAEAFWKFIDENILKNDSSFGPLETKLPVKSVVIDNFSLMVDMPMPAPNYGIFDDRVPDYVRDIWQNERQFDLVELDQKYRVRYMPSYAVWINPVTKDVQTFTEDRLIIPVWQHNRLIYWQARRMDGVKEKKYINPHLPKQSLLYNLDTALEYPTVMIFEGFTNVWRFGDASIALAGKKLSDGQKQIMHVVWGYDGLGIVCLDEDTYAENLDIETARSLLKDKVFKRGVSILRLRGGDAAQHTRLRLWQLYEIASQKAVTDPKELQANIIDEQFILTPPSDSQKAPAVDALVKQKEQFDALENEEDEDENEELTVFTQDE